VFRLDLPLTPNGKIDKQALFASMIPSPEKQLISKPEPAMLHAPENCSVFMEKSTVAIAESDRTGMSKSNASSEDIWEKYPLPEKHGVHGARALRHRFFSLYRRFFSVVFIGNILAMIFVISRFSRQGLDLPTLGTVTAANLTFAVLMRQDHVINVLFIIACSVPTWIPLFIRRNCAKIYHIGGLHSGCAVAATAWLLLFTIAATIKFANPAVLGISYALIVLLIAMVASAHPEFRARFHDRFELIH